LPPCLQLLIPKKKKSEKGKPDKGVDEKSIFHKKTLSPIRGKPFSVGKPKEKRKIRGKGEGGIVFN